MCVEKRDNIALSPFSCFVCSAGEGVMAVRIRFIIQRIVRGINTRDDRIYQVSYAHFLTILTVRFDDLNHDVKLGESTRTTATYRATANYRFISQCYYLVTDRLTCAHNCNRALEEEQVRSVLSSYRSRDNLRD